MAPPRKPKAKLIKATKSPKSGGDILNLDDVVWLGDAAKKSDTDEGLSLIEAELQRQIAGGQSVENTGSSVEQDDDVRRIIAEEVGLWLNANMARILRETLADVQKLPKKPKKKAKRAPKKSSQKKSTSTKSAAKKAKSTKSKSPRRPKAKTAVKRKTAKAVKKKKS